MYDLLLLNIYSHQKACSFLLFFSVISTIRQDEALLSQPFASAARDSETIEEMASHLYNWQNLVLANDETRSKSMAPAHPLHTATMILALGYYLNLKAVVRPSQVYTTIKLAVWFHNNMR